VVVEALDSAIARGAKIRASVIGYGAATDVHHLTQPHPAGAAALATMRAACEMAGLQPEQIDYLNAHGTGTPLNDSEEGEAIRRWAADATPRIKVSSTKGAIGHLLGGAGAVEAVICLQALDGQWLPPSLGVREADAICEFELVRQSRPAALRAAMTNSFGFGGANATLLFGREVPC
jgi:3-oxoacyl-[acyl-carrier-protein] synthase II